MYACQDPSSMRFVALYHNASQCERSCKSYFRPWTGSPQHAASVNEAAICADEVPANPSSMRFVPLYSKIKTSDQSGLKSLEDPLRSLDSQNSLCGTVRGPTPTRLSESCDGFAASSPYSPASKSSQSEFLKKSTLMVLSSSDSGVFNSASFEQSFFGSPDTTVPSLNTGKTISILRRNHSFEALNPLVQRKTEEVRRPLPNVVSILNKLAISDGTKDSSDDERTPTASIRRGRRPNVFHKRRLSRNSSKIPPHFKPFEIDRNSVSSAFSSFPSPVSDDNNNNESAEDSSSMVSLKRPLQQPKTQASDQECTFCKSNNETGYFRRSHAFKVWEPSSGVFKLNCPVLRNYICPRCGATGDAAHTYTYCPKTIREVGYRPKSLITKLKRTAHDSSGRRRAQNDPQHRSSV